MYTRIEDRLPNPFATDYQYKDGPLDFYTEEQMIAFAERIIKENAAFIKKLANRYGSKDDEVKNYVIIDSANKLLKHYGIPDE